MRVMVIILSSFTALIMVQQIAVPLRLSAVTGAGVPTSEAMASVSLFCAWTLATALVYRFPGVAVWSFAIAGVIGVGGGVTIDQPALVRWGIVAAVLAVLTPLAQWEKRVADQIARQREQQEMAVHLAMRSLQETVPELLGRVPHVAPSDLPREWSAASGPADKLPAMATPLRR